MKRRATTGLPSPGEVLVRAFRAANRGRYAEAGRLGLPSVRESMLNSARLMRDARKRLAAQIEKGVSPANRDSLLDIIATTKQFEDPNHCWKLSTRCGSLRSVAIARQTIKGAKARVTLRLTLENGSVVTESESLVLTPAGWRIGQITALQNKALHQTRREGVPASRAIVEARLAGEGRCCTHVEVPTQRRSVPVARAE